MSFLSRKSGRPDDVPALPYHPRSPQGLAARWVQWIASVGPVKNPLEDDTGEYAAVNQPDDVWFLAGSYGRKPMERRCYVPLGRELFLPAFNMWYFPADGPPPVAERAFGSIVLDGEKLDVDVIGTPVPFIVQGARLNGVTQRKSPLPGVVWGLWKLIPPLAPGEHELHVVGGDGHGFVVDVRYRLGVAPSLPNYPVT